MSLPASWSPGAPEGLEEKVRQELDGLQAEQLEFVSCGQILQGKDNHRKEKLSLPK